MSNKSTNMYTEKVNSLIFELQHNIKETSVEISKLSLSLKSIPRFFFWKRNIIRKILNRQKILLTKLKDIEVWLHDYPLYITTNQPLLML